jgi:hypothetical protein
MFVPAPPPLLLLLFVSAAGSIGEREIGGCDCFYVDDQRGNDFASGTSAATAWRTLRRVNNATVAPGTSSRGSQSHSYTA